MKKLFFNILIIALLLFSAVPVFSGGQGEKEKSNDEIIFLVDGFINEDPYVQHLRDVCDEYTLITGTKVVFHETDRNTYQDKLNILFAAGEPFDLFFYNPNFNRNLLDMGLLEDLTFLTEMNSLIFPPHVVDNGRSYSIPIDGGGFGIFYNKPLLKQYAIEEPETWDDLMIACESLNEMGIPPFHAGFRDDFILWSYLEINSAAEIGNEINNYPDMWRNREIGFNNLYMKRAVEKILAMEPWFQDNYLESGFIDVSEGFKSGGTPFMLIYTGLGPDIENSGVDFGFMGMPAADGSGSALLTYHTDLAVSSYSENPSGAADLIDFLLSPDIQYKRAATMSYLPVIEDVPVDIPWLNDIYKTFCEVEYSLNVEEITGFKFEGESSNDAGKHLAENLRRGLSGEMTADEILESQQSFLIETAGPLLASASAYLPEKGDSGIFRLSGRTGITETKPVDTTPRVTQSLGAIPAGSGEDTGDSKFSSELPPVLSIMDIAFSESVLDAGETAVLSVTLKNIGPGDARDVYVELSGGISGLSFPEESGFPVIEKNGGEQTISINISSSVDLPTGSANLNIRIIEPNFKVKITGKRLTFSTRKFLEPEIVLAKFSVEEYQSANPNNQIDLNEIIDVEFAIQNIGQRDADRISVNVENNQSGVMLLGVVDGNNLLRKEPEFSVLKSGKYEMITYRFFVNSEFTGDELEFNIRSDEKYGQFGFNERKSVLINTLLKEEGYIRQVQSDPGKYEGSGIVIEDIPDFDAPAAASGSLEDAPLVSVMDFDMGDGISDAEVRMIADIMSSEIFNTRKFRVIDRRQRETVLSEIKFSMSSCNDEACQLEAGKLLSADKIVVGSISKFGNGFLINIKLIQVETGETRATSTKMCGSKEELVPICKILAAELSLY